ncbi:MULTISPECIES: polysaccharide biosynthesis/export family protein [Variovorax]|jgi:polysaccharide export outer membrane protein|uniref:polysaccharide biosynthesis/export family protein n=1 Tax=Variovorax TaxID=34072 RepID=UPI000895C33E|nr:MULTISPECIES: polysaccharide biosynthesis/export family protein [Variovorax]SDX24408.1 polysaccharide export outer membrane protein [Variovorax sp. YR634]SDZ26130.1 polysaccharide export outer membrane protein [Variovorax sp. YR266]SET50924.1 polysaccharide export outer membrane protein [Variovorax sp. OV084]SOD21436.1 polysaccharide export outer membrane protein [Variovorax sp. YR752]
MEFHLTRYLYLMGWSAALAGALMLQGCAPGFGSVVAYEPDQSPAPSLAADGTPQEALVPISPSLIRAMAEAQPAAIPPDVKALFGEAPVYTIGPGDVVGVIVYDHPELLPNAGAVISQQTDPTGISVAPGFIVGANGQISFPYIGRVQMQGLTEIEASDVIAKRIARYIKDPQVTVRIQSFRSRRAFVEGEVRTPGLQLFTDVPMTLSEALNRAGGITSSGDRSFITLTRGDKTTLIDLPKLQDLGSNASKIPLQNGDVVQVRNRDESKVFVMGEVAKPSALTMHNGRLTLNEALGEAGSASLGTANTGQIYVVRNNANNTKGSPSVFHLNAKNPAALALAERFPLQPRDVVYIDSVPLATWSRVASLILPATQALYYSDQVYMNHR